MRGLYLFLGISSHNNIEKRVSYFNADCKCLMCNYY